MINIRKEGSQPTTGLNVYITWKYIYLAVGWYNHKTYLLKVKGFRFRWSSPMKLFKINVVYNVYLDTLKLSGLHYFTEEAILDFKKAAGDEAFKLLMEIEREVRRQNEPT